MVSNGHDGLEHALVHALEHALDDPPPWHRSLDDVVAAGRRSHRRRRATVAVGSSAAAVLAAGTFLTAPRLLDGLRGPGNPNPVTSVNAAVAPSPGATVRLPGSSAAVSSTAASSAAASSAEEVLRQRFFRAGYQYDDAVLLARLWGGGMTPDGAKVNAGEKLRDGIPVPVRPGETPETVSSDVAVETFFNHGYDYADATRLAELWRRTSTGDLSAVKATAGRRLLAGQALP